jgi:type IV secretion system protein VirD4
MRLSRSMLVIAMVLFAYSYALVVMVLPWALVLLGIALLALVAKKGNQLWSHGTARWATAEDLRYAGMLSATKGLILGRVEVRPKKLDAINGLFYASVNSADACQNFLAAFRRDNSALVRLPQACHTLICAPTGVGKGVSIAVPFLLTCEESCVVVDFKGELASITADKRRAMGHEIVILDPYGATKLPGATRNPLDAITATDPLAIDYCNGLADALVVMTGQERDPHWAESAKSFLAGLMACVCAHAEVGDRSLQTVRRLLTDPERLQAAIQLMCQSDAWEGMLARSGGQLRHYQEKELASVMTTAHRYTRFLDTIAVAANTRSSSFDPADLPKKKMSVYLVLPPDAARVQSPLLRMWLTDCLRGVARNGLQENNLVHYVIDEIAMVGHMEIIDDALSMYRGYGCRLQFYAQSLGQLKKVFPDSQDQTLLSNVSQVFFGINDNETAKYVSERLGEETILVRDSGKNQGWSTTCSDEGKGNFSVSGGSSVNISQKGRHLLKLEEVMGLSPRTAIIFTPGIPPLWTTLVRYYEESFDPPSSRQRAWAWLKMLFMAAIVLAVAIGAAWGMTALMQQSSRQPFNDVQWAR